MSRRHLYATRTFRAEGAVTAAMHVLLSYVDRVECGDAADHVIVVDPRADPSTVDPYPFTWTEFSADGRAVGGFSRADGIADLTVHRPGPWDDRLDEIPHQRDWWSWIQVHLDVPWPRRGTNFMGCLRASWSPQPLMVWLDPLDIDYVEIDVVAALSRRPMSRSAGTLVVERLAPPAGATEEEVRSWWEQIFVDIQKRYRLDSTSPVPYTAEDEGYVRLVGPGGSLPGEDALDAFVEAVDSMGATTDDWYQDGAAMLVPISGPDLAEVVRRASATATSMGLSVVEIHPDCGLSARR